MKTVVVISLINHMRPGLPYLTHSTVIKKMSEGEDTFEDLRLEKFTYHVAGEEVIDPKLNVPGECRGFV